MLEITVLPLIEEYVSRVTDAHIRAHAEHSRPVQKGDVAIGTLHNLETMKLLCAADLIRCDLLKLALDVKLKQMVGGCDELEQKVAKEQERKLESIYAALNSLTAHQLRDDMGVWEDRLSVEKDWMVVKSEKEQPIAHSDFLKVMDVHILHGDGEDGPQVVDPRDLPEELRQQMIRSVLDTFGSVE